MTRDPTHIRHTRKLIIRMHIKHILDRQRSTKQVSTSRMHNALRLSRRSGRVQQEERILGIAGLGRAVGGPLVDLLMPPPVTALSPGDLRTGALLAKPADGKGGAYETVFPVGFYTNFGGYLASNISLVDEIKAQGFNVVSALSVPSMM